MTEPNASAAASAGGKAAISGTWIVATLPLDPATFVVGLIGALWAVVHLTPPEGETRTPPRIFILAASGGFFAGVFWPVAVAGGLNYVPWLSGVGDHPLRMAAAFVLGAAPQLAPVAWRLFREWKGARS